MIRFLLIAFAAGVLAGWFARGIWEESAERDRLVSQIDDQRKDVHKQAKAESDEQDQQRHDAGISQKAADTAQKVAGWDNCPSVPAGYTRLLNRIGTPAPSTAKLAREMPGEAETSGD